MICQLDIRKFNFGKDHDRLYRIEDNTELRQHIDRLLKVASIYNVDMIVFPEFSIPESLVIKLTTFARNHNIYIIAGTDYFLKNDHYVSRCPVITPQRIYYVEKHDTSILERTPIQTGRILESGDVNTIFQNTRFGSFAITICADFMDDELKAKLQIKNLSMLIVPAYHGGSSDYHERMHINVKDSNQGLYVVYSNIKDDKHDSGKSGIFALVHRDYLNDYKDAGCTDCNPNTKIYQFKDTAEYAIFQLDMINRKPFIAKNNNTDFNVKVIAEDTLAKSKGAMLSQELGISGMHYQMSDILYVEPNEFNSISRTLAEKNVVVILGDPGTGKTYTAYKLMTEYFIQGYKPRWIHGYSKEDRITYQDMNLANYKPNGKEIIYLEDPFGHSTFDKREEIISFIVPLIDNIKRSDSKLIITSRREVFNKFNEQHDVSVSWADIIDEINITKPSYESTKLVQIAQNYIDSMKSLSSNLSSVVIKAIRDGILTTPLSIYDTILNLSEDSDKKETSDLMSRFVNKDLIEALSEEYNQQPIPSILLYAMVLILGNMNRLSLAQIHKKVQERMFFKGYTIHYEQFNSVLNNALRYRLHSIGLQQPVLRFRHASYEQAYCFNLSLNSNNAIVMFELVDYLLENSSEYFNNVLTCLNRLRFIFKPIAGIFASHICDTTLDNLTVKQKVELVRKMRTIKSSDLGNKTLSVLSPNELLQFTYADDKSNLNEVLRLLAIYHENGLISSEEINWKAIFTEDYLYATPVNNIVDSLNTANCIKPLVSTLLFDGLQHRVIYRLMLNAKENNVFKRVCTLLKGTNCHRLIKEVEAYKHSYKRRGKLSIFNQFWLEKLFQDHNLRGIVIVDSGALDKVYSRSASLYGVGIESIIGSFDNGDAILITDNVYSNTVLAFANTNSRIITEYLSQKVGGSLKVTRGNQCMKVRLRKSKIEELIKRQQ